MILLLDNYDSFVHNLGCYVSLLGFDRKTVRNDAISIEEIALMRPTHISVSPGPCTPDEAGISMGVIAHFSGKIPLLGVCLGHQAIAQAYGARIVRSCHPRHGSTCRIHHNESTLFRGLSAVEDVGCYYSLTVDRETLPDSLSVSAWSEEGEIMAIEHESFALYGVQFHPESILTSCGLAMIRNFLKRAV